MERTDIYITQGKDYCEMTRELLEACDLASDIGDRKKRVGIKPNLAVAKPASSGATTHPEVLGALLSYLREKGFENLTVLESSWVGEDTGRAVRKSGLLDMCREQGVPFHDTKKDRAVAVDGAGMELQVCARALEMDYLINMPVVKGHCQTTVTCALKNYKGLIPDSEKRRFHRMGLHRPIAHLGAALRQDFILADNICGDLDFEDGGNPVPMDRVLAFKDPVLCDSFAAETLGYRPGDIEYIRLAEELGVGSTDTAGASLHFVRPEGKREKKAAPRGEWGSWPGTCARRTPAQPATAPSSTPWTGWTRPGTSRERKERALPSARASGDRRESWAWEAVPGASGNRCQAARPRRWTLRNF